MGQKNFKIPIKMGMLTMDGAGRNRWCCFSLSLQLFSDFIFLYAVDGLDKASIANSDGPTPGSQTPPFKRKGKLSTIGKIFKPWKWRKKKTSDKFRETSAVLERKISTRQSREELIRRGVLKELPDQDGDVTVNFENSNGHMIPIGEESTREENVVKSEEGNGSVAEKAPPLEEKAEDKTGKIKRNPLFFYFNAAQC